MQTKNNNLAQNEVLAMPFLSPVRETTEENGDIGNPMTPLSTPSSVYLPVPPSSKGQHCHDISNGIYIQQCHQTPNGSSQGHHSTMGYGDALSSPIVGCKSMIYQRPPVGGNKPSAIYQPPPLPPRVGNPRNSNPTSPVKENLQNGVMKCDTLANGLATYGPYKPVPPPKPFGNQVGPHLHQQSHQMDGADNVHALHNGQVAYPHILVTDQGQFVTHSTKFPIEEKEKFIRTFNEKNLSQGIDNPALVTDSSMALRNHIQHKEIAANHYAQMRPYDPTKYPQYIPNGHQPSFYRGAFTNTQQPHQDAAWQNHMTSNSNRFSQQSVPESPDKKLYNPTMNQNTREEYTYYQPVCSQQSAVMRGGANTADHGKGSASYYQDGTTNPNDQILKYDQNGKVSISQSNGVLPGEMNCRNHYTTTTTTANGDMNITTSGINGVHSGTNGLPQLCDTDDKKEDKWESLKRAGKKCSNFKSIISNKFSKPEPKTNSSGTNATLTQNKGVNSQDLSKQPSPAETNNAVLNSERLHNGENHLQENKNFQRVVTYSSLKSRLEGPPQQTYNPSAFFNSERQSGRLPQNPNSNMTSSCSYATQAQSGSGILGPKRAESCTHLGAPITDQVPKLPQWGIHHRSDDNLTRPLASDQSYPEHTSGKGKENGNVHFMHPGREGRVSGSSDSGRGTGGGSATEFKGHDTSLESGSSNRKSMPGHSSGNESEWIDIPDSEAKQIAFRTILSNSSKYPDGSKTPPLPPLSPEGSPKMGGRISKSKKNSQHSRTNMKPDIVETTEKGKKQMINLTTNETSSSNQNSIHIGRSPKSKGWNERPRTGPALIGGDRRTAVPQPRFTEQQNRTREKEWRTFNDKGNQFDDDDVTSTDAALDLNSVLDGATEITTDDDLASTRDGDAYLIRRQLEGLEGMYSEVLKVLGGKRTVRPGDPRLLRRKLHGSMSSLPSSVMSNRGLRDNKKGKVVDDRLRRTNKDISKTTHRRFQRLESHVVTLARSVAHLSSEMRTQHLMLQEIESIRNDLSALKMNVKSPPGGAPTRGGVLRGSRLWNGIGAGNPSFSNPGRVKKLTQFFGDEPPLVRIFLKKLGYEKYAPVFEQEKIGMLELPYMTEDRLQKIGIPLGPRLRILEEARGPITTDGNLSVYVV